MKFVLQPWQLMLIILACWINRQQQEVIEYLRENAVLKEKIGKERILLTDDQRRRLAVKGKLIGRKQLAQFGTLFTTDTILRWHRQLVAKKWDDSDRKKKTFGRPRTRQVIVDLTVKFAKENPTWGYDRISGALSNVGYHICDSTIGNILKDHGVEPAPKRRRTGSWETFLKALWDMMASIDFTTVEVWTTSGLTTFYLLFVMELKTRRVNLARCTKNPNEEWIKTVALELTHHEDGFLKDKKYLIMDRDATFSRSFRECLRREGVKPVRLPHPTRPNQIHPPKHDRRLPAVGLSIPRNYKGVDYEVIVCENGFECEGDFYKSLSAIAKRITGSHWNGYRFFGLQSEGQQ